MISDARRQQIREYVEANQSQHSLETLSEMLEKNGGWPKADIATVLAEMKAEVVQGRIEYVKRRVAGVARSISTKRSGFQLIRRSMTRRSASLIPTTLSGWGNRDGRW